MPEFGGERWGPLGAGHASRPIAAKSTDWPEDWAGSGAGEGWTVCR